MVDITLTDFTTEHLPALAVLANDFEVTKTLSSKPYPYTLSDAEAFLEKITNGIKAGTGGSRAVMVDGALAGEMGWFTNELGELELGYMIGRAYWGRGIASRAIALNIAYLIDLLAPAKIVARVMVENPASAKVLINNGFVAESVADEVCPSAARGGEVMLARKYTLTL